MHLNREFSLVAVPVKDESERIADCLRALTLQSEIQADGIVLVVNNSSDGTASVVRELLPILPVPVQIVEVDFPSGQACAGSARRLGLELAADRLGGDGVLLTTDADGRVPPDWVAANLAHLRAGADAVAGRAVLDPADAVLIPDRLHDDDAKECALADALDAIDALLDPAPWDPLPRHTEHSGASIAVTLDAYRRAGGMPPAALAEDRRFFDALRQVDARIRHAPDVTVTVSGRTLGRAEGGMADTIRRRLVAPDPYLDRALEPAALHAKRARLRRAFRLAWTGGAPFVGLARSLALPAAALEAALAAPFFGEGWAALEAASPVLARAPVLAADVVAELAAAELLVRSLRAPVSDCGRAG